MRYPIAIEMGTETTAFGVVVPDLPGCFSAGCTLNEALANAEEATRLFLEDIINAGLPLPEPSTLEALRRAPEFVGWTWAEVSVTSAEDEA